MSRVAFSCSVETTRPWLMLSDKIIWLRLRARVDGRVMALCLNAGKTAEYLGQTKSVMAANQINISQAKHKAAPIPAPQAVEQRRITLARAKHAQLADAPVAKAVA